MLFIIVVASLCRRASKRYVVHEADGCPKRDWTSDVRRGRRFFENASLCCAGARTCVEAATLCSALTNSEDV